MIAAIVLAAGESRRMGAQKLLLAYGRKPVIAHVVDRIVASKVNHTVVVTGHDRIGMEAAIADRPVVIAHNARYQDGMLSSVRCGVSALPAGTSAFVVVLGDQPSIRSETIDSLLAVFTEQAPGIVVPTHGGKSGHPILVAARFRDAIMSRYDEIGLCGLLREFPDDVLRFPVAGENVLLDMDTPADYRRALSQIDEAMDV